MHADRAQQAKRLFALASGRPSSGGLVRCWCRRHARVCYPGSDIGIPGLICTSPLLAPPSTFARPSCARSRKRRACRWRCDEMLPKATRALSESAPCHPRTSLPTGTGAMEGLTPARSARAEYDCCRALCWCCARCVAKYGVQGWATGRSAAAAGAACRDYLPTLPCTIVPVCLRTVVLRDATFYLVGRLQARHRCAV